MPTQTPPPSPAPLFRWKVQPMMVGCEMLSTEMPAPVLAVLRMNSQFLITGELFRQWMPPPQKAAWFSLKMFSSRRGEESRQRTPLPEHHGQAPPAWPCWMVKPRTTVLVSTLL